MWKPCRDTKAHIDLVSKEKVKLINPMPLLSLAEYRMKCDFSHKVMVTSSDGNILADSTMTNFASVIFLIVMTYFECKSLVNESHQSVLSWNLFDMLCCM